MPQASVTRREAGGTSGKRRLLICLCLAALVPVAALAMAITDRRFARSGHIAHNVRIAGIPAGGKTEPEALEAVMRDWVAHLPEQIGLRSATTAGADKDAWFMTPGELGSRLLLNEAISGARAVGRAGNLFQRSLDRLRLWRSPHDIRVECAMDEDALHEALVGLAGKVDRQPRNAEVEIVDGEVEVVPDVWGRKLKINETAAHLAQVLRDPATKSVELIVEQQEPGVKASQLRKFEVVLGSYGTRFNRAKRSRTHNLHVAVRTLNKAIIMPGEVFSLNERLGPRQPEFGYREAGAFINGELVPSAGGGVCQISSTLYNAALLSNLRIRERRHHSMPVDYVPTGQDATVFYGLIDFKIENDLKNPVLLLADIEGNRLTVNCLGAKEDALDVELVRSDVAVIPHGRKEIEDEELPEGTQEVEKEGRDGHRVTLTRIVRRDDVEIKRERLHRDTYAPRTEVVRVGVGEQPAEGEAEPAAPKPVASESDG